MRLKIACVQYLPERLEGWAALESKLDGLLGAAARAGAGLVLFPEYAGMEIASLLPDADCGDLQRSIHGMQGLLAEYLSLHANLAHKHGLIVVAGSVPVRVGGGFRNRAHVFTPSGLAGAQDKLVMTRFEREEWGISAGDAISVFQAPFGLFAIAICYDSEFPRIAQAMTRAGATLLLVPSCTDTLAGFYRVRSCARARAVENQIYVVQAPVVGRCGWSPAIDVNTGRAGLFSPCDTGFPDDGVLAEGTAETAQVVIGELDFDLISKVRVEGQVLNFLHQQEVEERAAFRLENVSL